MTDRLKKEDFVRLLAARMKTDEATATAWVDGAVETLPGLAGEGDRDRGNAEQVALHRRGHRPRIDSVVAHVGAEIYPGHDEVRREVEQPGHRDVDAIGRGAVDRVVAIRRLAHGERAEGAAHARDLELRCLRLRGERRHGDRKEQQCFKRSGHRRSETG